MKRKASTAAKSEEFIWFWDDKRKGKKRSRGFASGPDFEDDDDEVQLADFRSNGKNSSNMQLELIHKQAPVYDCCLPLPYELLVKIFRDVVKVSDYPLRDLYNLCRVCEDFRQIILSDLNSLWFRLDLSTVPMTNNNVKALNQIMFPPDEKLRPLKEFSISGPAVGSGRDLAFDFIERALSSPKLDKLVLRNIKSTSKQITKLNTTFMRSIKECKNLKSLTITDAKLLFGNQKWISDFLAHGQGHHLETLDLSLSMTFVGPVLQRSICNIQNCPNLKVLDLTTCDCILTNSFDIAQLALNAPNLEVFRAGNVSFRRVTSPPVEYHFKKLRELSIPIAIRDADRDDPLYASIAYGSYKIRLLDIRGSIISAHAIIDTPSMRVEELHMDDICPITRPKYGVIMKKWQESLVILSLVKINCSQTIQNCLQNLMYEAKDKTTNSKSSKKISRIRELDLSSSNIEAEDLYSFLMAARDLESINLTSCRSLPRGCKGLYKRTPDSDGQQQKLSTLLKRLSIDQPRKLR